MRGKTFPPLWADAQYKVLKGEHTPNCQIYRVDSMHKTNLKGVNLSSCASKMCKLCTIGSPYVFYLMYFCMLVNHGPSQQSSKEEYKPWK